MACMNLPSIFIPPPKKKWLENILQVLNAKLVSVYPETSTTNIFVLCLDQNNVT